MTAGVEPDGRGGPHAFVTDVDHPELSDDDRHHLARSLRLGDGDPLTVADGQGRWRRCRFGAALAVDGDVVVVDAPTPALTVAFALVKGARPDLVVQKLTELGIDHIAVFAAERSVVRWDEAKVRVQRERLTRVAREAAMQCRRAWLPQLEVPADLRELVTRAGSAMADFDGGPVTAEHHVVLIGPEGGWTETERALGRDSVRLGRHVQRAETAAISAAVQLAIRRDPVVAVGTD